MFKKAQNAFCINEKRVFTRQSITLGFLAMTLLEY